VNIKKLSFIEDARSEELAKAMREEKEKYQNLEVILVILEKERDSAYGISVASSSLFVN
jgi:hypothetical protein